MLAKLQALLKETSIYGVSTVIARGLNYFLVPFYANLLSPEENGIQGLIYTNIAFAMILYTYGMEQAYLKFAAEANRKGESLEVVFATPFLSHLVTSATFSLLIAFFADILCDAMHLEHTAAKYVRLAALILFLDTLITIPMTRLRQERRAAKFALIRLTNVLVTVVSSLVFLLWLKLGLTGAFLGNLAGSLTSVVWLLPAMRWSRLEFSPTLFRAMLRFGLPFVPNGLAAALIHFIDRNILIRLSPEDIVRIYGTPMTAEALVGIYMRIYAFATLLQLVIQMFRFAWQPFFLQHAADAEAKRLFSRVMTLSSVAMITIAFLAALFVPHLIQVHWFGRFYILPPPFWVGLSLLPVLFLSPVFEIVHTNLAAGLLIEKKTEALPIVTAIGAAVTFLLCLLLIPLWGMMGAAASGTAGALAMTIGTYIFSQRIYPNSFEWGKIGAALFSAALLWWLSTIVFSSITWQMVAALGFIAILCKLFWNDLQKLLYRASPAATLPVEK
ncbi:MAG: oligosaccharide flippase family protein [Chloroherpetonaceae bacterium]|nr:oligosaccharide flippase family protein [Chloroherpetonaceae bacterium]